MENTCYVKVEKIAALIALKKRYLFIKMEWRKRMLLKWSQK